MPKARTSWRVDHDARWRPDGDGPPCDRTFRKAVCGKRGPHYCAPRADRVVAFFPSYLCHTKGAHKRKPFVLRAWQEHEIIRPLFGEVLWSDEWGCYVRRYRIAYVVVARKNGKSELAAGILLYLLCADDEEAAEVYGAAKDTKQAGKVFEPAARMVELSSKLRPVVRHNKHSRRLIYERTASYYEIITADAKGELGHNPHGFCLDEVLSQPDGKLWEALETAVGARLQELLVCLTTETDDPHSFGADLIDEADRVMADPARAPHAFAFVRRLPKTDEALERLREVMGDHPDLPVSLDPFDEANWKWPNPGLDEFKSRDSMRRLALEAHNEPKKENGFRQLQCNQRVQQVTRFMPLHLWDACKGEVAANPSWLDDRLAGQPCVAGLDLSARFDLTAWALLFDNGWVRWRLWLPEAAIDELDPHLDGKLSLWAKQGWVTATDGDVIDYDRVYADIASDHDRFRIRRVVYDK
jgi:phage terminase large subunit-like protein